MHIRHRPLKAITKIGVFYLFLSVGISLVSTIWSVYLNSFLHNQSSVGFLSSLFTVLEILAYLFFIPLVEKGNKIKMLISTLVFFVIAYAIFSTYSSIYLVIGLGALIAVFSSMRIMLIGLIVRDKTEDVNVSKNEGFVYTLLNIAWLVSPLFAGYVAKIYGFGTVFIMASMLILISIFLLDIFKVRDDRRNKIIDKNILKVVLKFFSRKERRLAYFLSAAVSFWWAFIYVYMPLYIVDNGYGEVFLGIFLAGVAIPLIFCEYMFGKLAGKRGFKKMFFVGFLVWGLIVLSCFFIPNGYVVGILLMIASIFVAMVEPNTEAYFMDIVKEGQRDRFYGLYTTAINIGGFFGSFPAAVILLVFPFKSLFIYYSIPLIVLAFFVLKMKDSYEFKKIKENTKF